MENGINKTTFSAEAMNLGVEVKDSNIEGKGVFATRDFAQGEAVFVWDVSREVADDKLGELSQDETRYLTRHNGKYFVMPEPMRFMNHSCEANTKPENGRDVATRVIKKGEEITSDYRPQLLQGERMDCHCGASTCQGFIIGTAV